MIESKMFNEKDNKDNYPCLKKTRDHSIILLNQYRCGMVILADKGSLNKVGDYRRDWNDDKLKLVTGAVLLRNLKYD
jgi:hypothetical protein